MKRVSFIILIILTCLSGYAQEDISIDTVINNLDWQHSTETDLVYFFRNNISHRSGDEDFGDFVSKYSINGIRVGVLKSKVSYILVEPYSRKLGRINIIFDEGINWENSKPQIDYLITQIVKFFGNDYKTIIDHQEIGGKIYEDTDVVWKHTEFSERKEDVKISISPSAKICALMIGRID